MRTTLATSLLLALAPLSLAHAGEDEVFDDFELLDHSIFVEKPIYLEDSVTRFDWKDWPDIFLLPSLKDLPEAVEFEKRGWCPSMFSTSFMPQSLGIGPFKLQIPVLHAACDFWLEGQAGQGALWGHAFARAEAGVISHLAVLDPLYDMQSWADAYALVKDDKLEYRIQVKVLDEMVVDEYVSKDVAVGRQESWYSSAGFWYHTERDLGIGRGSFHINADYYAEIGFNVRANPTRALAYAGAKLWSAAKAELAIGEARATSSIAFVDVLLRARSEATLDFLEERQVRACLRASAGSEGKALEVEPLKLDTPFGGVELIRPFAPIDLNVKMFDYEKCTPAIKF